MIRLDLKREPEWLDLAAGVRVRVAPLTTAMMVAARNDPAFEALPKDLSREEVSFEFAKAVGRRAILDWEGVADAEGEPAPVSPEAIDAVLDIYPLFQAFQLGYVNKGLMLEAEKNGAPRPRRMDLRRGRVVLRSLRGSLPGLPRAVEPTGNRRGVAGLGPCSAARRAAASLLKRRRAWMGSGRRDGSGRCARRRSGGGGRDPA